MRTNCGRVGFGFLLLAGTVSASSLFAAPANDDFANAEVISGTAITVTTTNNDATAETGEPRHGGAEPTASIWWEWTSPVNGEVDINTLGSGIDTVLGVYTGSTVDVLVEIGSNDDDSGGMNGSSRLNLLATSGVTYYIAVDGFGGAMGDITLNLAGPEVPPPNDDFANRIPLTGMTVITSGTNINASIEGGEPPDHAGNPATASVWWEWTAPDANEYEIGLQGSSFDTVLAVYTGSVLSSLGVVRMNDNFETNTYSKVFLATEAGEKYQIVVDGKGIPPTGRIALKIKTTFDRPANDDFANREEILAIPAAIVASNENASAEIDEPDHAASAANVSLWWTWQATANAAIEVDTIGSDFDTVLAVYTGSSVTDLTEVVANDDGGGASRVMLSALLGTTYHIAVDGFQGATGEVHLNLTPGPPGPPNDAFADAMVLSGFPTSDSGVNINATVEAGEPASHDDPVPSQASVWWVWTAPLATAVSVDTFGSNFDTILAVYEGTSVGSLTRIASNNKTDDLNDQSSLSFVSQQGVTYYIAVDGQFGNEGNIVLNISGAEQPVITNIQETGGDTIELTWDSVDGTDYEVQRTGDLFGPWSFLASHTANSSNSVVAFPGSNEVFKIYRVVVAL